MASFTVAVTLGVLMYHVSCVGAHSWLDCVDWDEGTGGCRGYARNFHKQPAVPLGQDVGRDNRPGRDVPQGLVCDQRKEKINDVVGDGYNSQYPMTVVSAGQKLMWRWPAKNHADVGTQRGVQLFISKGPGLGDDFSHIGSKSAWLAKNPGLTHTFSNCYQNGARVGPNVDRAECYGTFQLPADLLAGVYTFMWWWEFNSGEYYNSCADVTVVGSANGGAPNPTPLPGSPLTPTPSPPPGNSASCPLIGNGLPPCVSECYCGFTGADGSGCGVDDGSSCWCKCCCHFRGGCSYRMPDDHGSLSSATTVSMSAFTVAVMFVLM